MLQVPNAVAQLMAGPLFRRGVGPDDFFRKQIEAERGKVERR
jgi:stalled ribosome alternative rescue factor ArfA